MSSQSVLYREINIPCVFEELRHPLDRLFITSHDSRMDKQANGIPSLVVPLNSSDPVLCYAVLLEDTAVT